MCAMPAPIISRGDLHEVSEFANGSGEIMGTEPQLNEISFLPLKEGRWLNELDGAQRRNVIVLGNELLKTLFPGRPAVGAFVLLNGIRFEVVGSMPHLGRGDNMWLNMRGYIPFEVMAANFPLKGENHQNSISFIEYQPRVTAEHVDGAARGSQDRRRTTTNSMPAMRTRSMSGTRSRNRRWWERFSMS